MPGARNNSGWGGAEERASTKRTKEELTEKYLGIINQ